MKNGIKIAKLFLEDGKKMFCSPWYLLSSSFIDVSCIRFDKIHLLYSRRIRRDDIQIFVSRRNEFISVLNWIVLLSTTYQPDGDGNKKEISQDDKLSTKVFRAEMIFFCFFICSWRMKNFLFVVCLENKRQTLQRKWKFL